MAKVTIEDISRATGLSRGTVSRALNDRPDISTPTKQRVLEACKKLNYVPSHAARSLATGRNYAVAVVVDDLASVFAAAFLRGVTSRTERSRYVVHVVELGHEPRSAGKRLQGLADERIDGALIAAPLDAAGAETVAEALGRRNLAACWPLGQVACDVLTPDQRESGRLAARHLFQAGAEGVLYVHREDGTSAGEARLAGFSEVARERGLEVENAIVRVGCTGADLAALGPRLARVRAVAAADDFLAIELMLLGAGLGRVAGRDLSVIGQGNERAGERIRPSLTTVDFSGEEIGRRAAELVLQRIEDARQDAPQTVEVAPRLIRRESA